MKLTRQDVWLVLEGERVRRFKTTVFPGPNEQGVLADGRPVERVRDGWEYSPSRISEAEAVLFKDARRRRG